MPIDDIVHLIQLFVMKTFVKLLTRAIGSENIMRASIANIDNFIFNFIVPDFVLYSLIAPLRGQQQNSGCVLCSMFDL